MFRHSCRRLARECSSPLVSSPGNRACPLLASGRQLSNLGAASGNFGLLVDIDGVLYKGTQDIEGTREGFGRLSDKEGNLQVPVVFLTNGSFRSEEAKAAELTARLGVRVVGSQIVLVNTPLRTFNAWHDKSIYFAGQGSSLKSLAGDLGFTRPVTVQDVARDLPMFDVMSHRKRLALESGVIPATLPSYMPIEGIVITNTPLEWEVQVQFLLDLLLTHGRLGRTDRGPQLPLIACNPDLVWASEYHIPRLACGAFVHMLAALWLEMRGRQLEVTWCGKPTQVTYEYALETLRAHAGDTPLDRVYGIGDNVDVDIVGANSNGVTSVLVCSGLYKNKHIDLAENVMVQSKRASVTEPITAQYAAATIGRFIDFLIDGK